jgi:hypothetical protein
MVGRQARASTVAMRLWEPHDPGRSCLLHTIPQYLTNQTHSQNAGALVPIQAGDRFPVNFAGFYRQPAKEKRSATCQVVRVVAYDHAGRTVATCRPGHGCWTTGGTALQPSRPTGPRPSLQRGWVRGPLSGSGAAEP